MSDEKSGLGPDDRGDLRDPFTAFYNQYHQLVYVIALKILRNKEAAEDVMIQVFEKIFRRQYDIGQVDKPLLNEITKNACIDYINKYGPRADIASVETTPITNPQIVKVIDQKMIAALLAAEIEELPEECRKVMKLVARGLSNVEIAKILEISPSTVANQKATGISKLREALPHIDVSQYFP